MADSGNSILHWSGVLTTSQVELTDSEIINRYGTLMQSAVSAFRDDPSYVVEMAEASAKLRARRGNRKSA